MGQFLLNLTMPVTLWLLYLAMPDSPGFAFGLAASALWPGTGWQDDERAGVVALRADQLFFRFDCDTLLRKEDSEWGEANIEMCVVLSP